MASSVYGLNAGNVPEEQRRLEWNHWNIWLPVFNNTLLPQKILDQVKSAADPRVIDVGTGTGVWLASLSAQLPSNVRLDGMDMDTSKFPDQKLLPGNVELSYGNALDPFPLELQQQYDVVHVRAFVFALRDDREWEKIVANLISLLKPGGWMLWEEIPMSSCLTVPLGDAWVKAWGLVIKTSVARGVDPSSSTRLLSHMEKAGLVEGEEVVKNTLSGMWQENMIVFGVEAMRQYCLGLLSRGGGQGIPTRDEIDAMVLAVETEAKGGYPLAANLTRTWGRKAVDRGE